MSSFNRNNYQKLIELARELHAPLAAGRRRDIAVELFAMAEEVLGQQMPPLRGAPPLRN